MASITLKSIPPVLHKAIRAQAKRHRRSLNKELIAVIEESVKRDQPFAFDKLDQRIEQFRSTLKFIITDEEINRFKREGRP